MHGIQGEAGWLATAGNDRFIFPEGKKAGGDLVTLRLSRLSFVRLLLSFARCFPDPECQPKQSNSEQREAARLGNRNAVTEACQGPTIVMNECGNRRDRVGPIDSHASVSRCAESTP